jgi:hypothetical protein
MFVFNKKLVTTGTVHLSENIPRKIMKKLSGAKMGGGEFF